MEKVKQTGVVFLVPRIEHVIYENKMTGEVEEYFMWNPKEAGVITGIEIPIEKQTP
jgi:hypothetical protein